MSRALTLARFMAGEQVRLDLPTGAAFGRLVGETLTGQLVIGRERLALGVMLAQGALNPKLSSKRLLELFEEHVAPFHDSPAVAKVYRSRLGAALAVHRPNFQPESDAEPDAVNAQALSFARAIDIRAAAEARADARKAAVAAKAGAPKSAEPAAHISQEREEAGAFAGEDGVPAAHLAAEKAIDALASAAQAGDAMAAAFLIALADKLNAAMRAPARAVGRAARADGATMAA